MVRWNGFLVASGSNGADWGSKALFAFSRCYWGVCTMMRLDIGKH